MASSTDLRTELGELLASQRFAVLATQHRGEPYTNLVAFASTPDLNCLLFATSRNTRKYANALPGGKVALLIDSRTNRASDLERAVAVTALGTAEEVTGEERERLSGAYVSKHPKLARFVSNPSNALVRVRVAEYIVASFDKVRALRIGGPRTAGSRGESLSRAGTRRRAS